MRALLLLLALAGCAATGSSLAQRDRDVLARDLAQRQAGEPRSCVPQVQGQSLNVVDGSTLTYDRGGTIWVNTLRSHCPGLRPTSTIIVEAQPGQYCNGDRIRSIEPGTTIPGPICLLGDWIPYRTRV